MIIATVPYINALPLTFFLRGKILKIPPSQMLERLLSNHVDVALMPVFSCLKHKLNMYLDAGIIGCNGMVKSVGFFTKPHISDLSQITSIYFDRESLTSVHLAKVIMKKFYHLDLDKIENHHFDNRKDADAQLLIGDKALFFKNSNHTFWDLGDIWKQNTGFGFIFATWASKRKLSDAEISELTHAKNVGLEKRNEILKNFPLEQHPLLREYFKKNIVCAPTPELIAGMELYQSCLQEYGYIDTSSLCSSR